MHSRTLAAVVLAAAVVSPLRAAAAPAPGEATLLRVFLTDGTSLVSYGEPARVNDRVIFSMPTATTPDPPLHLVNLPVSRVDWDRTSRYAATARASHYVETQAETDYAALSNDVAATLNEVALTAEPSQRLAIVQRARQTLADWPQSHFNYRAAEVRQLLGMLDEAIAAMRDDATLRLEIEGHTCNIGTAEYNLALGDRRATSVRDYLAARGVSADRLRTVSYGEERPKYDNSREETRRLNRRAALVVNLR